MTSTPVVLERKTKYGKQKIPFRLFCLQTNSRNCLGSRGRIRSLSVRLRRRSFVGATETRTSEVPFISDSASYTYLGAWSCGDWRIAVRFQSASSLSPKQSKYSRSPSKLWSFLSWCWLLGPSRTTCISSTATSTSKTWHKSLRDLAKQILSKAWY